MLKKFRINVDGRPYTVTVEDISADAGNLYPHPGGVMDTTPASVVPAPAPVAAAAPAPAAPAGPAPAAGGPGDQITSLGGVIVSVDVTLGQVIKASEKIAVIEAMKMKTTAFSQTGGKVVAIHVKPGDAVDAGQALITLG
ncbi:MAG: acetyl-CoA carboxylase biotin carboxyl carrier protein subunit [Alphaproteobacteria bacterium]